MSTQARLHELFEYRNGVLYRKINQGSAKAGVKVGSINHQGYVRLSVDNKNVPIHRVIWIMHHGETPLFIDHIDNNRKNNNIENLRLVNRYGNAQNASMRKDNTSGAKGVSWHKGRNKWTALIAYNRKQKHLGCFNTKEDAAEFVSLARDMLHKEYANHGTLSRNTQVAALTLN